MRKRPAFCDGHSRRDVLKVGVASLFGMCWGLADVLAARAAAGESGRDVSLIILFLKGGLSTIDTWDLKPEAPREFRGEFRPIETVVPGIQIGEHLPRVAQQMDKLSLIRSFNHRNSDHGPADTTCSRAIFPAQGSIPI
mgnify:CR=1 FL=1